MEITDVHVVRQNDFAILVIRASLVRADVFTFKMTDTNVLTVDVNHGVLKSRLNLVMV